MNELSSINVTFYFACKRRRNFYLAEFVHHECKKKTHIEYLEKRKAVWPIFASYRFVDHFSCWARKTFFVMLSLFYENSKEFVLPSMTTLPHLPLHSQSVCPRPKVSQQSAENNSSRYNSSHYNTSITLYFKNYFQ